MIKWFIGLILTVLIGIGVAVGLPFDDKREVCWDAPTTNTDGSPLLDLAGYKLYWSKTSGAYLDIASKDIGMAVISGIGSCYTVTTLEGTYNLVVTAYNIAKIESVFSNEIKKNFAKVPRSGTNLR